MDIKEIFYFKKTLGNWVFWLEQQDCFVTHFTEATVYFAMILACPPL